jgi:hypothetical protein
VSLGQSVIRPQILTLPQPARKPGNQISSTTAVKT